MFDPEFMQHESDEYVTREYAEALGLQQQADERDMRGRKQADILEHYKKAENIRFAGGTCDDESCQSRRGIGTATNVRARLGSFCGPPSACRSSASVVAARTCYRFLLLPLFVCQERYADNFIVNTIESV